MKNRTQKISMVLVFALFFVFLGVHTTFAQDGFVPLADLGSSGGSKLSNLYTSKDLAGYMNALFAFAISLGGVLAVLRIAYAGYLYMGTDSWAKKGEGIAVLQETMLGLLLLLSIYLILWQINPGLLDLNVLKSVS